MLPWVPPPRGAIIKTNVRFDYDIAPLAATSEKWEGNWAPVGRGLQIWACLASEILHYWQVWVNLLPRSS